MTPESKIHIIEKDLAEFLQALTILDKYSIAVPKALTDLIRHYRQVIAEIKRDASQTVSTEPLYTLQDVAAALGLQRIPTDAELLSTDFSRQNRNRVHDWRNYANDHRWITLTPLGRLVDYAQAVTLAEREEWD